MNSVALKQLKQTVSYQSLLLGVVTALATAILFLVANLTASAIQQQNTQDKMAGLNQVLPPSLYSNDLLATERGWLISDASYRVFIAKNASTAITGLAIQSAAKGYSGDIQLLLGLDAQQQIIAVRVLSHTETPGLGDKIERAKSDWIDSFYQLSLQRLSMKQWAVKKDGGVFDQFTGATITPRAVVGQVQQTLLAVQQEILPTLLSEGYELAKGDSDE